MSDSSNTTQGVSKAAANKIAALGRAALFSGLSTGHLEQIANFVQHQRTPKGEAIFRHGDEADSLFIIADGEVKVALPAITDGTATAASFVDVEIARLGAGQSFGEMGIIQNGKRRATVTALCDTELLVISAVVFRRLWEQLPRFGVAIAGALARRLMRTSRLIPEGESQSPSFLDSTSGDEGDAVAPRLNQLLTEMIKAGASHLSPMQRTWMRVNGDIEAVGDSPIHGPRTIYDLLLPVMRDQTIAHFEKAGEADFAYSVAGLARFRVNIFRDNHGIGAVFRHIPDKIESLEKLGLPRGVAAFCEQQRGLVLVTGPTGSGKSTTLAAMIDAINHRRRCHIVTIEDPIEFVHRSDLALVNQREVGAHTRSFANALRSALREDPDVILVGELRDLETITTAMDAANTGHLVLATLHTSSAISTVDRIVDSYPADQQRQVRTSLSEALRGVVSQTLCRRRGGGRIAAMEVMVVNSAIANLIREGKTHQLENAMTSARVIGNMHLEEHLRDLQRMNLLADEEVLARAAEKASTMMNQRP